MILTVPKRGVVRGESKMSGARQGNAWTIASDGMMRRILVVAGIAVTALTLAASNWASASLTAASVPAPITGLSLPISTPPVSAQPATMRAATALSIGTGQQTFLDVLNNRGGPDFVAVPDSNLVDLVYAVCADLSGGYTVVQTLQATLLAAEVYRPSWVLADGDMGFLIGAAVSGVCPRFASLVEQWVLANGGSVGVAS
jgi:hypothetical protein